MSHHCGLVFENILQRDEGIWKCKMDLTDVFSNTHRFKKVIDLKVRTRRRRRHKRKSRGGYGGGGYVHDKVGSGDGSGEGSGDEHNYDSSNKLRTRRRIKRKRRGGSKLGYVDGYHGGFGSGDGSGEEPGYYDDDLVSRGVRIILCMIKMIMLIFRPNHYQTWGTCSDHL